MPCGCFARRKPATPLKRAPASKATKVQADTADSSGEDSSSSSGSEKGASPSSSPRSPKLTTCQRIGGDTVLNAEGVSNPNSSNLQQCNSVRSSDRSASSSKVRPDRLGCWQLATLERLCESFCSSVSNGHRERSARPAILAKRWRTATEGSDFGRSSDNSLRVIRAATDTLASNLRRTKHTRPETGINIASFLYGLMRLSPHHRFFEEIERVFNEAVRADASVLARLSISLHGCPACVRYVRLVRLVGEAIGMTPENLRLWVTSTMELLTSSPQRVESRRLVKAIAVAVGLGGFAADGWTKRTLNFLYGSSAFEEGIGGLSVDAFLCVAFQRRLAEVKLHCYDISGVAERILGGAFFGVSGIFHSGLVVHGREYWYGGKIHQCHPGSTRFGKPSSVIKLGYTLWTKRELVALVHDSLAKSFTLEGYDVIHCNCNDFSNALSMHLMGKSTPEHIRGQAEKAMSYTVIRLLGPYLNRWGSSQSNSGSGQFADEAEIVVKTSPEKKKAKVGDGSVFSDSVSQSVIVGGSNTHEQTSKSLGQVKDSSDKTSGDESSSDSSTSSSSSSSDQDSENEEREANQRSTRRSSSSSSDGSRADSDEEDDRGNASDAPDRV